MFAPFEKRGGGERGAAASKDHDLNIQISSAEWLRHYGLKQSKLSLNQILAAISFKHSEGRLMNAIIQQTADQKEN